MPLSGAVLAGAGAEALGDCCEQAAQAQATAAARISVGRGMARSGAGKSR
jgi:hypothetical protein